MEINQKLVMLDRIIVPEIKKLIEEKKFDSMKKMITSLSPEDIAVLITDLEAVYDKVLLFRMLPPSISTDVFENLDTDEQRNLIFSLSDENIKFLLNDMAVDERTELFEELPVGIFHRLLKLLTPEQRKIATEILGYPEDSVGRLITPDYVRLYENMNRDHALLHIRKVGLDSETIYNCYVLGKDKKLIGIVSLKNIVLANPDKLIKDIMKVDVVKVNVYTDKEEAAKIFKKYGLIALPVVDAEDRLLGIVTFDDFVDVLEEEATEDFEKIAGVLPVDKPYLEAGFFEIVWKRSFWLIVLLVLESMTSIVMQFYSVPISKLVALTFFLPILIGAGGNAGTQSATVIIRGLATEEIKPMDFFRVILRESALGLFIGITLSVFGLIRAFLQQGNWWLSVCVGISMGLTILMATTVGAVLPLIFRKLRIDPALMSGPLITTIVDVSGIAIYFEIATVLLRLR